MPDFLASDYARWRASRIGKAAEDLERSLVFALLGDLRGLKTLDVGCGDGTCARMAAERGAEVHGLDSSLARLESAKLQLPEPAQGITWIEGNAQSLPFPDRTFDRIVAVTVLCLIPDPQAAIAEMARVLKPDGLLVFGELNRWSLWSFRRKIKGWTNPASPWRHVKFRSASEWKRMLKTHGFIIQEVRGCVYFPPWLPLARALYWFERPQGRRAVIGPAFLALSAVKN